MEMEDVSTAARAPTELLELAALVVAATEPYLEAGDDLEDAIGFGMYDNRAALIFSDVDSDAVRNAVRATFAARARAAAP